VVTLTLAEKEVIGGFLTQPGILFVFCVCICEHDKNTQTTVSTIIEQN